MIFSTRTVLLAVLTSLFFVSVPDDSLKAQVNQCPSCWVPFTRHRFVTNANISPTFNGYAELLPKAYTQSPNKKFPLIIFLHGQSQAGDGASVQSLCNGMCAGLPLKIEQGAFSDTVYSNGQPYSFIVLSPQYNYAPGCTPADINAMISYAISHYRVDASRIYLTGLSLGASHVMDYLSSSAAAASRIAAVVPLAGCNGPNPAGASYIANQKVHYWGIHCASDFTCSSSNTVSWSNSINSYSQPNNPMAQYTLTPVYNDLFPHDIFYAVYDSAWKQNNKNFTQWMIQFTNGTAASSLPISMERYEVLQKGKNINTEWTTSIESNTDYFLIERAGSDMVFKTIGKVAAAGNSSRSISYSFTDVNPLKGNSFYRLVLINKDGLREVYEIKSIVNRTFGESFTLTPTASTNTVLLNFELDGPQKIEFLIRDVNGRMLQRWSNSFSSGIASLPLNISKLKTGIYYITAQGSSVSETKKFVRL